MELTDDREPRQPDAPQAFPAPVARFAGTILLQVLLNLVLYDLLVLAPAGATLGACALLAVALAAYCYTGWLRQVATRWKIATFAALAINALSVALYGLVRIA